MRILIIPITALTLALAPAAQASVTIIDDNDQPVARAQAWADSITAVPVPTATITFTSSPCPGIGDVLGCAVPGRMWLDEANPQNHDPKDIFLHEMGHEFGYFNLGDTLDTVWPNAREDQFMALVGLGGQWRRPGNSPVEQFAEAYRLCAERARPTNVRNVFRVVGGAGYMPRVATHRRVCRLIRSWA